MKNKIVLLIIINLLTPFIIYSQISLSSGTITHKKGEQYNSSYKWYFPTWEVGTYYRNLTFDIKFDDNCIYVLKNTLNSSQQTRKQKVIKLATDEFGKNSLRIGWNWNPEIKKIQLAFYSHINHDDDHPLGREFQLLEKNINTGVWVHVEMAIAKKGMFMSIDGQSILVSRNIFSWSPSSGETTFARANSYFEYKDSNNESQGAPHEMTFQVKNAFIDLPSFPWGESSNNAPIATNIQLMNTNYKYSLQGPYSFHATKSIIASINPSSPDNQIETEQPYEIPYTVVEPKISVIFQAGESIHLKHGFHAKSGSHFRASICPQISIVTPAEYDNPFCYHVENVTSAKIRVEFTVYETGVTYFIGNYSGTIIGDEACFEVDYYYLPDEYGTYNVEATFSNDCMKKKVSHYYVNYGKKTNTKVDSLQKSNIQQEQVQEKTILLNDEISSTEDKFSVYPNPTKGLFKLQVPAALSQNYTLEILNSMGFSILQEQNVSGIKRTIDLSQQAKGIYFIKIVSDSKIFIRKVVVK